MAIIWPGEAHIKTFSDVPIFRKCGLNTCLDHFQILAIYGENMDKTEKKASVVPFSDNGHIWRKYGRQVKKYILDCYINRVLLNLTRAPNG